MTARESQLMKPEEPTGTLRSDKSSRSRHACIIVIAYEDTDSTIRCLESIERVFGEFNDLGVVVLDNGSRIPLRTFGGKNLDIEWIRSRSNLGYAAGCNFAIKDVLERNPSTEYFILMNNDVIVYEDFLSPIVKLLDSNPKIAISGPVVTDYQSGRIQSMGAKLTRISMSSRKLNFGREPSSVRGARIPRIVDYVSGCALVVRTSVIRELDGFDERFFLYEEEVDLCLRATKRGYSVVAVPVEGIAHAGSRTVNRFPCVREYHSARSRMMLIKKHRGRGLATLGIIAFLVERWSVRFGQALLGKLEWRDLRCCLTGTLTELLGQPSAAADTRFLP